MVNELLIIFNEYFKKKKMKKNVPFGCSEMIQEVCSSINDQYCMLIFPNVDLMTRQTSMTLS